MVETAGEPVVEIPGGVGELMAYGGVGVCLEYPLVIQRSY